jgi:hypothetical protein
MSAFVGELEVRLIQDTAGGLWQLLRELSFQSDVTKTLITVLPGFRTDFCSVPRIPFVYDLLGDRARKSGTIHDYLYTAKPFSREICDKVLKEMLLVDGVDELEAEEFFLAVRAGGASHW